MELISGREAGRRFAPMGLSLSGSQQLLATGIAGWPVPTTGALLYDGDRVREVAERAVVGAVEFRSIFGTSGCLVARLPRETAFDWSWEWQRVRPVLVGPWPLDYRPSVGIVVDAYLEQPPAMILTVAGFVVAGAQVTGYRAAEADGQALLSVEEPGRWIGRVVGRPLMIGRGRSIQWVGGAGRIPRRMETADR